MFASSRNTNYYTDYYCIDGGLFSFPTFHSEAIIYATSKVLKPTWIQIFLRGILANWLVTMAVFLSNSSREISSKVVLIWFPTTAFTAL
jgi:formate/nitrite transporter FocA (FNT family)